MTKIFSCKIIGGFYSIRRKEEKTQEIEPPKHRTETMSHRKKRKGVKVEEYGPNQMYVGKYQTRKKRLRHNEYMSSVTFKYGNPSLHVNYHC